MIRLLVLLVGSAFLGLLFVLTWSVVRDAKLEVVPEPPPLRVSVAVAISFIAFAGAAMFASFMAFTEGVPITWWRVVVYVLRTIAYLAGFYSLTWIALDRVRTPRPVTTTHRNDEKTTERTDVDNGTQAQGPRSRDVRSVGAPQDDAPRQPEHASRFPDRQARPIDGGVRLYQPGLARQSRREGAGRSRSHHGRRAQGRAVVAVSPNRPHRRKG